MATPTVTRPPLEGVRVLDLTRVLAGPFATYLLAELGAEVLKVEPPGGDAARAIPPFINGESTYFLSINSGKRGISVDLRAEEGRAVIRDLVQRSHAVLHNFRSEAARALGLDFEVLRGINPRIVSCSISGFGTSGSMSGRVAYDVTVQGMSGLMAVTGHPGGPPARLGVPMADLIAGVNAALGTLAALRAAAEDGVARHVDAPLFDGALGLLTYVASAALATGEEPGPVGSGHHSLVPYAAYRARDGWLVVAVLADKFWGPMCHALGFDELAGDAGLSTKEGRLSRREEVDDAIAERLAGMTRDEALRGLEAADVPCAPVNSVLEALRQPLVDERGLLRTFHHPRAGAYRALGAPLTISPGTQAGQNPAPVLGEHTRAVLTDVLGYAEADVARMEEAGVVVCGDVGDEFGN